MLRVQSIAKGVKSVDYHILQPFAIFCTRSITFSICNFVAVTSGCCRYSHYSQISKPLNIELEPANSLGYNFCKITQHLVVALLVPISNRNLLVLSGYLVDFAETQNPNWKNAQVCWIKFSEHFEPYCKRYTTC